MSDKLLHLVRHGEVHNPDLVLYGRIPGFRLSERGHAMAEAAALELAGSDRKVAALYASPLERAQQSARPIASALGLEIQTEDRIIEPTNFFEGKVNSGPEAAFKKPRYWFKFWNPFRPSWGEPYRHVAARVREAMDDAWNRTQGGDIVMVAHQSPIWMAHLDVAGKRLFHNPATRRCDLSSITTFERRGERWFEVDYRTPAKSLTDDALDVGAV
ncbi:histidine phosphatase family protein [Leucobacter komagatae]|uniref:Phosphoglycerate mutase n=1 Tax=Leucobacter komagatae TaxID=55969 RepID=A0A0D0IT58_9MICO|nr:histidine phosphatase family protein [Leucobacter komagatae]KIP52663.1 phosphoglycerate mutase [Leucobacter komagatae]